MAVIELHDLTKRFGELVAVDHVSFEVESGQVVGFLGPNGAGKTTTLRMLLGLASPTEGSATINGRTYQELDQPLHIVGAVLDASEAHPGRTARNHLRIQAMLGEVSPSRIDEMLDLVDLTSAADRRVGEFSLGMRQRLGLATALLTEPEILILDEPANGLDPEGVRWLRQLLRDLAAEGRTVLVSSHVLGEVAHTVDSVVILDCGQLVTHSTLAELTAGSAQVVRIRTPKAGELRLALEAIGAHVQPVAPDSLEISGASVRGCSRTTHRGSRAGQPGSGPHYDTARHHLTIIGGQSVTTHSPFPQRPDCSCGAPVLERVTIPAPGNSRPGTASRTAG